MPENQLKEIIGLLSEMETDSTVPKNIKLKAQGIIKLLNGEEEVSIRVSRALSEMEDIADDVNLPPYTRTQVWNIVSLLEKV